MTARESVLIVYSNRSHALGVEKKIHSQAKLLQQWFDVTVLETKSLRTSELFSDLLQARSILCRDSFAPWIILIVLLFGGKTILECNRPYKNLEGRRSKLFQVIRFLFFVPVFWRSRTLVCVTQEIERSFSDSPFSDKTISFPNFVTLLGADEQPVNGVPYRPITFAFVGDLTQHWQGKGVIESILLALPETRLVHIGPKTDFAQPLAGRIKQTGILADDAEILQHLRECDIGLSALNFMSRRMLEASPLKHGLFVRAGLWIVTGCEDSFLKDIYPVTRLGPDELDPAQLKTLFSFEAVSVKRSEAVEARKTVGKKAEEMAGNYIDLF